MPEQAARWSSEGDNAVILARAILEGVVTDDIKTFLDFFDPSSLGPGAEIGKQYKKRNLKLNWQKLLHKIKVWKSNKPDPKTGKCK